jgi:predicted metal-dependent hydrolase
MSHGIDYSVKTSKKAKRLRIVVNCDANVSVVTPQGFDIHKIDGFVAQKAEWIRKKILFFKSRTKIDNTKDFAQTGYYSCNARAKKLVKNRVDHFNKLYNLEFNRISIKKQSTKWGSCSGKKNLNFNYKILFLPSHLADYLVVHELCHLKEMNHSHKFWKLVEKTIPDYKKRKKELQNLAL